MSDYKEVFGREPEPWRIALGAVRLTSWGDPIDAPRLRVEIEELMRILNEESRDR